jgi:hypothetical protein
MQARIFSGCCSVNISEKERIDDLGRAEGYCWSRNVDRIRTIPGLLNPLASEDQSIVRQDVIL